MNEKYNRNIQNMYNQIINTVSCLNTLGLTHGSLLPMYINDNKNNQITISWQNHESGRENCGNYFNRIDQYLYILKHKSYIMLLKDYSIIRCSFTFDKNGKLLSENLLWWPCPVKTDSILVEDYLIEDLVEDVINGSTDNNNYMLMRSPIRVDYDCSNNTEEHPASHMHIQHHESRINTVEPICFNKFVDFIIKSFYPDWKDAVSISDYLPIRYDKNRKSVIYDNRTTIYF